MIFVSMLFSVRTRARFQTDHRTVNQSAWLSVDVGHGLGTMRATQSVGAVSRSSMFRRASPDGPAGWRSLGSSNDKDGPIMTEATPLLDRVNKPEDLRRLGEQDLRQLADELRRETINAVAVTGGHLGAGLGVIELTVALHYVFDTPRDRVIWDVGHQAYPHKILTERRARIRTLRQGGGLSGFTKRAESDYD